MQVCIQYQGELTVSSFFFFKNAIILMGKRELVSLPNLSSWCLVMVERLFLAVPWGCLRFVYVVFPDYTHLLFLNMDLDSINNGFKLLCT